MNADIRLSVEFFDHPKTIKLQRRLGLEGVHSLLRLWTFAAKHKSSGVLSGMDDEEIALAAKWPTDPSTFVTTLVEVRYLDVEDGYTLHDWIDHNGYASSAADRSDKSRFSRMSRSHKALYEKLKAQGYEAISAEEYKRLTAPSRVKANERITNVEDSLNDSLTNRTSPLPSPLPSPSPIENTIIAEPVRELSPEEQVVLAYNKFCPSLPKVLEIGTSTRWVMVKAIFTKYRNNDGGPLHFLDTLFKKAEASDRITNRDGGWRGYPADLDWLLKEENYQKVIEGKFDNGNCPPSRGGAAKKQGFKGISDDLKKAFS